MMTRKNYEQLAEALASADTDTVNRVADVLQADNPRFDRLRFWKRVADWKQEQDQDGVYCKQHDIFSCWYNHETRETLDPRS